MSGQMPGGTFDVNNLWVTEPAAADVPAEAIPQGGEFMLHATFTGSGTQWANMKNGAHSFIGEFHVEGIGGTEVEADYAAGPVTLDPATDTYEFTYTVTAQQNTLPAGLYRCGVTAISQNWAGTAGFYEGLVFQIY